MDSSSAAVDWLLRHNTSASSPSSPKSRSREPQASDYGQNGYSSARPGADRTSSASALLATASELDRREQSMTQLIHQLRGEKQKTLEMVRSLQGDSELDGAHGSPTRQSSGRKTAQARSPSRYNVGRISTALGARVEAQYDRVTGLAMENDKLTATVASLRQSEAELEASLRECRRQLDEERRLHSSTKKAYHAVQRQYDEVVVVLEDMNAQRENLHQSLEAKEQEASRLRIRETMLDSTIGESKDTASKAVQRAVEAGRVLADLQARYNELQVELSGAVHARTAMESRVQECEDLIVDMRQEYDRNAAEYQRQIDHLTTQCGKLSIDYASQHANEAMHAMREAVEEAGKGGAVEEATMESAISRGSLGSSHSVSVSAPLESLTAEEAGQLEGMSRAAGQARRALSGLPPKHGEEAMVTPETAAETIIQLSQAATRLAERMSQSRRELQSKVQLLEAEKTRLQGRITQADSTVDALKEEADSATAAKQRAIDERQQREKELKGQIKDLKAEMERQRAERQQQQDAAQAAAADQLHASLQQAAQTARLELEKETQRLTTKFSEEKARLLEDAKAAQSRSQAMLVRVRSEMDAELAEASNSHNRAMQRLTEAHTEELQVLKDRHAKELERIKADLKGEAASVQRRLDAEIAQEKQASADQAAQASRALSDAQFKYDQIVAAKDQLQNSLKSVQQEASEAATALIQLRSELTATQASKSQLLDEAKHAAGMQRDLKQKLEAAETEIERLTHALSDATKSAEAATRRTESTAQELEALRGKLKEAKEKLQYDSEDMERLTRKLELVAADCERRTKLLEADLHRVQTENSELHDMRTADKIAIREAQDSQNSMQNTIQQLKIECERLEDVERELGDVRRELRLAQRAAADAEGLRDQAEQLLQRHKSDAAAQHHQLSSEVEEERERVRALQRNCESLQYDLDETQRSLQHRTDECEGYMAQCKHAEQQLQQLQLSKATLQRHTDDLREQLQELEARHANLSSEHQALQRKHQDAAVRAQQSQSSRRHSISHDADVYKQLLAARSEAMSKEHELMAAQRKLRTAELELSAAQQEIQSLRELCDRYQSAARPDSTRRSTVTSVVGSGGRGRSSALHSPPPASAQYSSHSKPRYTATASSRLGTPPAARTSPSEYVRAHSTAPLRARHSIGVVGANAYHTPGSTPVQSGASYRPAPATRDSTPDGRHSSYPATGPLRHSELRTSGHAPTSPAPGDVDRSSADHSHRPADVASPPRYRNTSLRAEASSPDRQLFGSQEEA